MPLDPKTKLKKNVNKDDDRVKVPYHEVPLDPKTKLKKNVNKDDDMVKVPYQQVVGSLI